LKNRILEGEGLGMWEPQIFPSNTEEMKEGAGVTVKTGRERKVLRKRPYVSV
jgi:hypothetical protein